MAFKGEVLLAHSIELFENHDEVARMVLVVPGEWDEPTRMLVDQVAAGKVASVVTGGATRAESVAAGLAEVPDVADVVLVHDAARPLASPELISRVLAGLSGDADGVVPAIPVPDTIKRTEGSSVQETLDRRVLVAVQTPQAFTAASLRAAYDRPAAELQAATDCASLVELAGTVVWVEGERSNIKITTPEDLRLAEAMA